VVTFAYLGRKVWNATLEHSGSRVEVRTLKGGSFRPCQTHAGYLLDEYMPTLRRRLKDTELSKRRRFKAGVAARKTTRGITVFNGE